MNTRWTLRAFLLKIFTSGSRTLYSKRAQYSKWRFPRLIYRSTLRHNDEFAQRLIVCKTSVYFSGVRNNKCLQTFNQFLPCEDLLDQVKWMYLIYVTDFLKSTNDIQMVLLFQILDCVEILCSIAAVFGTFLQSDRQTEGLTTFPAVYLRRWLCFPYRTWQMMWMMYSFPWSSFS